MKELLIDADVERLDEILDFINTELETGGCDFKTQAQIDIAVEEIFVNIAHYAYKPKTGDAVVRIASGDEVIIEFEDSGKPFNPLEKKDPDLSCAIEEREIGGLGVFMVKQIMDSVTYKYLDNKNILTMRKAI